MDRTIKEIGIRSVYQCCYVDVPGDYFDNIKRKDTLLNYIPSNRVTTDEEAEEYRLYLRLKRIQQQSYTEVFIPVPQQMINTAKDIKVTLWI